jgi:hypothetical protein
MRRLLVPLLVAAVVFPAATLGAGEAADGSLAVRDGHGKIVLVVRGSLIGRFGAGSLMIEQLSEGEGTEPVVRGYKTFKWGKGGNARTYAGKGVRFRLIGGRYRVQFNGKGLHFSLVGRGRVQLDGHGSLDEGVFYDGFYSLNGSEEESLPDEPTWLNLGGPPPPPPPPPPS